MSLYKNKFNPLSGSFNLVPTATIVTFKPGVANAAALPLSGNTLNDGRITADTGHLYVWDGTTWVDSGDIIDLKWSAIDGKPTSLVADIDNAVSLRHAAHSDDQDLSGKVDKVSGKSLVADTEISKIHAQGTDQGLDTGGTNAVTAAQAKAGYSHSQVAHAPSDAVSLATVKADTDIDDAIDKKHSQGTDQGLDTGGTNAVTAAQAKAGYSHSQVAHAPSDAVSLATVKADTDIDDAIDKKHASGSDDQDLSVLLKLDQVSPQTIINGIPLIDKAALDFTLPAQLVNKSYVDSKDATVGFAESYIFCEDAMFGGVNASPLLYSSSKTYALNEVVISSIGLYWRSLQAGNINQTLAENTWWTRAWHELEKKSDGGAVGSHTAVTTSYTEMDRYVSAALATTVIPEGIWSFELFSKVSASNKTGQIKATIYRISSTGAILATLGVAESQVFTNTIVSAIDCEIFIAGQTGWNLTDRIGVIISGKSSAIMTWYHDIVQGWVSIMNTPIVTLHNQLAGLNEGNYQHLTATEKSTFDAIPSTLVGDLKDISLNVMLNAFRIAQIGSLTIFNMVKGFMDEYEDESGIDLVNSENQVYNSSDDYYSPFLDTSELIAQNIGTPFGDMTAGGGLASGFDNNQSQAFGIGPRGIPANGLGYIGKDWGSGNTNAISAYKIYGSSDYGFDSSSQSDSTITTQLYGSDSLPLNSTDGILLQSSTFTDPNNASVQVINSGINTSTAYRYHWVKISSSRSAEVMAFSEVEFYKVIIIIENMELVSNNKIADDVPTSSRIVLFEEDVDSITINTDLKAYISRDNGTTFSQVTLEDEGNYITGARILSGVVDISAQPSGSNIKYKIETLNSKNLKLHGTAVSWK